ncbi:MAG: beta-L-arabinofuranosidase domain-containing protein [Candidatus Zipacnadales bacterium]
MRPAFTLVLAIVAPWGVVTCMAHAQEMTVPMKLQAFDLRDVTLEDGPCLVAREANRKYLLELDPERLLHAFRVNAGLPSGAEPLGGWEAPHVDVRGHFTGHYLSACALMYRSTGDKELKRRGDYLVAELAKVQERLGGGYLSAFPEEFLDRLETRNRVPWVPLYVIHKIMAGLYDMYTLAQNKPALNVLVKMADYYKARADRLTDFEFEQMLQTEFGGMSEVLHNLYGLTGNPNHLTLANRYDQAAFLGPLALHRDNLSFLHGNTQIPKICGAARRYELTGEDIYRDITEFFWHRVVETRCYATGGTTSGEHWPEPNRLAETLSATNQECCKTHNMLKVTRYLIRWTADPKYADYYERAFWNGIMGTNHPETGQLIYYVPLATGHRKVFGQPYDRLLVLLWDRH